MATQTQSKWIIWETKEFAKKSVSVRGEGGIKALRSFLEKERTSWDGTISMDGRLEVKGELEETPTAFTLTFYRRAVDNPKGAIR